MSGSRTSGHIKAICIDFGDTLADDSTEVKDATGTTLRAELIPGAAELIAELKHRRFRLALVADGKAGTYFNVLSKQGLYDLFDVKAISDQVGVEKPDRRMFVYALDHLGISPLDYHRTIMVGNHLSRDIEGANLLGMISIWLDWAPRREKNPADASEVPQYTIRQPLELLVVLDKLEKEMGKSQAVVG